VHSEVIFKALIFACHFRARNGDLLWLEDDFRVQSANKVHVGPRYRQDGQKHNRL